MKIRAYNCLFGDCYCIDNLVDDPLFVDFGIHRRCKSSDKHIKRYNSIIEDISNFDSKDFLLTHYHEDHYSGLVRMMEDKKYHKSFGKVYLPFIPLREEQEKEAIQIIELILINGILRFRFDIDGLKKYSFIKLLESVYNATNKIVFLKRGDCINGRYKVLWPDVNVVVDDIKNYITIYGDFASKDGFANTDCILNPKSELNNISLKLLEIMRIETQGYDKSELDHLQKEYIGFAKRIADKIKESVAKSNNISNEHCIVFHNDINEYGLNILFTGDVGKQKIWTILEPQLHSSYSVIKVPHHGTAKHYHDFTKYLAEESYLLIPNGGIPKWKICSRYPDFSFDKPIMVCNSGCFCEKSKNTRKCICSKSRHVVDYTDIDFNVLKM